MNDFRLTDNFIQKYVDRQPSWGPLGLITFKRTYARPLPSQKRTEEWWETIRRVVEGTYSIQKQHCKTLKLPWNENKAQRSAQEMFALMWDMKFLPPGRGLWMMGTDFMWKRGGASLNNCLAYDTEIITNKGIVKIGDCSNTEQVLLTSNGKWVKAPINSFGKQQLYKLTISRAGITKDLYVTKDHRWFVSDRRKPYRDKGFVEFTTENLRPGVHRLECIVGQGIQNTSPSSFGIAHGIAYGDGTKVAINCHSDNIVLCGNKNKELAKYFYHEISITDETADKIYIGGIPNSFKELPSITESKAFLVGWLMGYLAADGGCDKNGQVSIDSYDKKSIEFVRNLCAIIGIYAYEIQTSTRISNLTNKEATCYSITLAGSSLTPDFFLLENHKKNFISSNAQEKNRCFWTVVSVEPTSQYEEVYCATIKDTGKFALAGNILTGNCSFCSTKDLATEGSEPFCFMMDMSMLGVGVGSDTKGSNSIKIREPRKGSYIFTVEDSREGWIELCRTFLDAYFGKGSLPDSVDYSKVRPYGSPIVGFGGTASGPGPLEQLIKDIPEILNPLIGEYISSTAIVDLFNAIGRCVVSGNVRRSAEIMLGDATDLEYLDLKDPKKHKDKLDAWRWASNNSVFATVGMDYSIVAEKTANNGEPGYFWLDMARHYGRMKDGWNKDDEKAEGCNPCSEQTLESYELCCLVETFPGRHETYQEYERTLKFAYLYAKTVTLLPTHNARTNAVMLRNRRIGTSQSGIIQSIRKFGLRAHFNLCDQGYQYLRSLDRIYSRWLCIPESVKITSVKPSGTVSLLPGATPGIHFPYGEYYWRTIRMDASSDLVKALHTAGYRIVEGEGHNTVIVYFPVKEENFWKSRHDVTIWEQLELVAQTQYYWADNQVSVTVTFKPEEAQQIYQALQLYDSRLKSVSFLPLKEHGYKHAPYQPMTQEEYEQAIKKLKPIKLKKSTETEGYKQKYCDSDHCELI